MRKDKDGCTVCNTREEVDAQKTIEKEMARLDAKLETTTPEDFLWCDYDELRNAMFNATRGFILSEGFCRFTRRHRHILVRLIKEGGYNAAR